MTEEQERAAFEKEIKELFGVVGNSDDFYVYGNGTYRQPFINNLWKLWQARAVYTAESNNKK